MTLRTITAVTKDTAGEFDNTEWVFSSELRGADGEIITSRPKTVKPVAGQLSVRLEPGPTTVQYGGKKLTILVPDHDEDLWTLLSAAVGVPINTPADLLAAAVQTFVETNPGYPWSGLADTPDFMAVGPTAADARAEINAAGLDESGKLLPSQVPDSIGAGTNTLTGTCSTAAATAAKTVTLDSPWATYTPVAGDRLQLAFTSGNTATAPTLSVNGAAAKPITNSYNILNSAQLRVGAGFPLYMDFDGTRWIANPTCNDTYGEISSAEVINNAGTATGLISGRRAEDLLVNEATNTRTLSGKTISGSNNTITGPITDTNDPANANTLVRKAYVDAQKVFVNVKDYGATGNGSTDDTASVQNAINAAGAAGGGIVYFPPGTYLVTPTSNPALTVTSNNVTLAGAGRFASVLKKSANGTLISFHGTGGGDSNHVKRCGMMMLGLNGNDKTGYLIRAYYAGELSFSEVYSTGNLDVCVDAVELWDSRFWDCTWDYNGIASANSWSPNVRLRNSAAASGFGYSTDSCNQIHFVGCRWESFSNGALCIEQGVSNSSNPNGFYVTNCKMESFRILGGPILKIGDATVGVVVHNLYMYAGGFGPSYSTPVTGISMSGSYNTLRDIYIGTGATACLSVGVDSWASSSRLDNVVGNYQAGPSTGTHITLPGGGNNVLSSILSAAWGSGTAAPVGGSALASNLFIDTFRKATANAQTASYTLALADAYGAVEMNVASANNLTVPPNSTVAFEIGTVIEIGQLGAGQTTIVAGSGVTIRSAGGKLKLTGRYSTASLRKRATDEWWLVGDITT